ncbi:MAG: hypothetical protein IJP34_02970 [Clostridia bacterium]|nr:hypothetical protein [Clostridia bacterium]
MELLFKNTVSAERQLKDNEYIRFTDANNSGVRVMFLGNSITLHGIKPDIGWHNFWGMAASAEEKDYVHILMRYIRNIDSNAAFCVCQGSKWEVNYLSNIDFYSEYASARDFGADIIIVRLIENCDAVGFNGKKFKEELMHFIKYLSGEKSPKIILTTSFWRHTGDLAIAQLAEDRHLPLVELGDLGENKEMMAIGLFEHEGVSIHPGDKGMQYIADRIFKCIKENNIL